MSDQKTETTSFYSNSKVDFVILHYAEPHPKKSSAKSLLERIKNIPKPGHQNDIFIEKDEKNSELYSIAIPHNAVADKTHEHLKALELNYISQMHDPKNKPSRYLLPLNDSEDPHKHKNWAILQCLQSDNPTEKLNLLAQKYINATKRISIIETLLLLVSTGLVGTIITGFVTANLLSLFPLFFAIAGLTFTAALISWGMRKYREGHLTDNDGQAALALALTGLSILAVSALSYFVMPSLVALTYLTIPFAPVMLGFAFAAVFLVSALIVSLLNDSIVSPNDWAVASTLQPTLPEGSAVATEISSKNQQPEPPQALTVDGDSTTQESKTGTPSSSESSPSTTKPTEYQPLSATGAPHSTMYPPATNNTQTLTTPLIPQRDPQSDASATP